MKVKMKEVFQGRDVKAELLHEGITVSILEIGESYVVSQSLGDWLIENGKAEKLEEPKPVEEMKPIAEEPKPAEEPKENRRRK